MTHKSRKAIDEITKVMHYEPLLCTVVSKNQINTKLKQCVGRYFNYALVDNDKIKYIGYTGNLYHRMLQHKPKQFNKVLIMEFESKKVARANEKCMIKALLPESNYQEGTKENETRATFIVNEELLEKLKGIAYWERTLIKNVINTALKEAVDKYEKKSGVIKAIPTKK